MTSPDLPPDRVRGVTPVPFAASVGLSPVTVAGDSRLIGWSVIEVTGAAIAQMDIVDGQGASATTIAVEALAAGQSVTRTPGGTRGIQVSTGLFLLVNAGSVRGVLYVIDN